MTVFELLLLPHLLSGALAAEPAGPTLVEAAKQVRYSSSCSPILALHHRQSLPIPARAGSGLRYRVLFYPTWSKGNEASRGRSVLPPVMAAEFSADATHISCGIHVDLPENPPTKRLGPVSSNELRELPSDAVRERAHKYYRIIEQVGLAFHDDRRGDEAVAAAKEFLALFDVVSEPGLKKYYRALSPEFWKWVEAAARK